MSAPTTTYINRGQLERIYLTYKSRIAAENRMKRTALWSQIIVAWYSVWITAVSLADLSNDYVVRDGGVVTAFLSIAILAASIFLYGQRFEIRAIGFRECYLKLRELYDASESEDAVLKRYNDMLLAYENHAQCDYDKVFFDAWVSDKPLYDPSGSIVIPKKIIALHIARTLRRIAFFAILLVAPVAIVAFTISRAI